MKSGELKEKSTFAGLSRAIYIIVWKFIDHLKQVMMRI